MGDRRGGEGGGTGIRDSGLHPMEQSSRFRVKWCLVLREVTKRNTRNRGGEKLTTERMAMGTKKRVGRSDIPGVDFCTYVTTGRGIGEKTPEQQHPASLT